MLSLHLFRTSRIAVTFQDIPPYNNIDRSLFDLSNYARIQAKGLSTSPIKLIHCSSVHYQPRYKNSPSQRFLNAFFEVKESFSVTPVDTFLRLQSSQSSELKKSSSEVLAVGICVALSRELFNIPLNRIAVIEGSGKRCDFTFEKDGQEFTLESKGREHDQQIKSAISDVFAKKAASSIQAKYGVVSHLPRNGQPVVAKIVDPNTEAVIPSSEDSIRRLLSYYSKAVRLTGFWRLADLLNERSIALERGISLSELDKVDLDYQNIVKLSRGYKLRYRDLSIETFFPADRSIGFRQEVDNQVAFFSIDKRLIELLERQDFNALLEYRPSTEIPEVVRTNDGTFSVNDDGTVFGIVSRQLLEKV